MDKVKNKVGRPKKEKKGVTMWIPDICVEPVRALIEGMKQQNQQQAKTS
jgi:hypothetical protein